jgi:hypothetical protein
MLNSDRTLPSDFLGKYHAVVQPLTNANYQFYIKEDTLDHGQFLRYYEIAGLSDAERELFLSIIEDSNGEKFSVDIDKVETARALASYGLVWLSVSFESGEHLAGVTRIGLLIYEYSFVRNMRTIAEQDD